MVSIIQCLVHKATCTTSNIGYFDIKLLKKCLKQYNNHINSFRQRECMNEIELSKNVWNLKDHGFDNNLSWEIYKKGLIIPMWFVTLQSMFAGKSFHNLC